MTEIIADVEERCGKTYLPEQYYLAEKFLDWRHIGEFWNWEVWPEWDDPKMTHPVQEAVAEAARQGWGRLFKGTPPEEILRAAQVWHFSGMGDTAPWRYMHCANAAETKKLAIRRFAARDPGHVVATALSEWRDALDTLLMAETPGHASLLADAVREMRAQALDAMDPKFSWPCEGCGEIRGVREITDLPAEGSRCSFSVDSASLPSWACAECVVAWLRSAGDKECTCWTSAEADERWGNW